MDASKLTNNQLYQIIQNNKLDAGIRALANSEFKSRGLSFEKVKEAMIVNGDDAYVAMKQEPLQLKYIILIMLFPFFLELQALISGHLLAKGYQKKWKQYWRFLLIGLVLWMIGIIVFARYYIANPVN